MTRLALLEVMSWACEHDPETQLGFSDFYEEYLRTRSKSSEIEQQEMILMIDMFKDKYLFE